MALKYFSRLELDEDGREWAQISGREASRMGRLLEDVLLYSKPVKLDLKPLNLSVILKEFINANRAMGEQKQLYSKLLLAQDQEHEKLIINADSDRLNQILLNIYRNAIEAAEPDSQISYSLQCNYAAQTVTLTINNKGDIIPENVLQRIGEPFFTTKSRGTGLGMGIVKRMIEAHGGYLKITSSVKLGTDVAITLPYMSCE
ncbi:sensor histidine kinase [sulfur-oxidizing endosymbiont of Gigantopelta aegis]|uniref:sensor histidine kinase n=1 Tax=sulfur-oxidizing endosymbiont of Gigantopelta aegis TaxID=2794934 RepID=UPI0018DEC2AA|nr:ATP-binding protein [sulfur-oxidizing endosymbiont of Gigantopelta aegis]